MSLPIRAAIIGDQFVHAALFETALRHELSDVTDELEVHCLDLDWPDVPLQTGDEVKEFLGDPAVIASLARSADLLLTHVAPVTRNVIQACDNLKIVGCCRGGPVNVNVAAATERGIPVVNAPARNSQAVVEFTIGLIAGRMPGHCQGPLRACQRRLVR